MIELFLILLAYVVGSVPTSVWVSKYFFAVDIRDYGSGNAGATNTYRVLGAKWGTFVMIVDVLKGVVATSLVVFIPLYMENAFAKTNFMVGLGLSAILGHIFPVFADFKGGKGVATLFGMVIALQPIVAICCVGVFLLVLFLTRFVSLSSILASVAFAVFILFIWNEKEPLYRIFAVSVALMVILTHQKNINRILKGTESKVVILKHRDRRKNKRKSAD
ncbi:MAG: glycerol-3-phosphate 1-O-acyltransferase PlsY [Bacteroidota bacterium]|nr:glycerol-3-phosphate 1-O-acyltransferase PlsY [Bacteroidota bacterium]